MDCWEPMVFVANSKGVKATYAKPSEGFLLWAMAAYIVKNPNRSKEQTDATYALLDFMLGGWYGAKITSLRGYMTNPQAVDYAKANPSEFSAEEAAQRNHSHLHYLEALLQAEMEDRERHFQPAPTPMPCN